MKDALASIAGTLGLAAGLLLSLLYAVVQRQKLAPREIPDPPGDLQELIAKERSLTMDSIDLYLAPLGNRHFYAEHVSLPAVQWLADHGLIDPDNEPLVLPRVGLRNVTRAMGADGFLVVIEDEHSDLETMYRLPSREVK